MHVKVHVQKKNTHYYQSTIPKEERSFYLKSSQAFLHSLILSAFVRVGAQFVVISCSHADRFPTIPEVETLNNLSVFRFALFSNRKSGHTYLSRISQVCLHFHFLQNANLDTHTCPNFLKCVQICDRKGVQIFSSVFRIRFSSDANLDTFQKFGHLCVS